MKIVSLIADENRWPIWCRNTYMYTFPISLPLHLVAEILALTYLFIKERPSIVIQLWKEHRQALARRKIFKMNWDNTHK